MRTSSKWTNKRDHVTVSLSEEEVEAIVWELTDRGDLDSYRHLRNLHAALVIELAIKPSA